MLFDHAWRTQIPQGCHTWVFRASGWPTKLYSTVGGATAARCGPPSPIVPSTWQLCCCAFLASFEWAYPAHHTPAPYPRLRRHPRLLQRNQATVSRKSEAGYPFLLGLCQVVAPLTKPRRITERTLVHLMVLHTIHYFANLRFYVHKNEPFPHSQVRVSVGLVAVNGNADKYEKFSKSRILNNEWSLRQAS